ncbi:uncharacterized protein THITE_2049447 [Thermothielavioides terrestris NRRL 8126]|uniref:Glycogen debranching enzyme n=1 Tax=Thermothielavioides terrestris (strain ATCC 38088 / NRRL 8126) TaxID=578455 RepID=G2R7I5_THETT|nr:uncharacterized protein THITE_2049447 [Thermothielavioides terrestris NRRL 8126]AEO67894.1 hypothetical protein THITE_2049447 [Thermothielavioides terrestris NRRL 8126]
MLSAVWLFSVLPGYGALAQAVACSGSPSRLHIPDQQYDNYFLSDCHSSAHVVVTNPLAAANPAQAVARLLVAWPAGNSGAAAFFSPENGTASTLGLHLENSTSSGEALDPVYEPAQGNGNPRVGVAGQVHFDSPAVLTLSILGSIRNIRDYTEGGGVLNNDIQNAIQATKYGNSGATVSRMWFDNTTTTWLDFAPSDASDPVQIVPGGGARLRFGNGTYSFRASFNYPQLQQLSPEQVLNNASQGLVAQNQDQTTSLSFLSYKEKLLAGTWRFLTYFGRDTLITALLMQPVLSEGQGGAMEAVISAALERINQTDGTVCHEEVIGDFATLTNLENGVASNAPSCDYKMIDTDYYLPIVMKNYFVDSDTGRRRASDFLATKASFLPGNAGLTYLELAQRTAEKIMRLAAPFAAPGGQTVDNLMHLNPGVPVGEWRDSNNGLGGGRIPFDVNTALMPAALRAIAALSRAGFFSTHPDWKDAADRYAQVWEDETLQFFRVSLTQADARNLLNDYVSSGAFAGPSNAANITRDGVVFYGLALRGDTTTTTSNQPNQPDANIIRAMHTDDSFRHFLLNTTDQAQLSAFLSQTADHILAPFPAGLATSVGLVVANPAYYGADPAAALWTTSDYHGTVVWSWPQAMMAAGLGRQLGRGTSSGKGKGDDDHGEEEPAFCRDKPLREKVRAAYHRLWDLIEANAAQSSEEMWTWRWDPQSGFVAVPFSDVSSTESDVRQLWSLAFLAVRREDL